MAGDWHKVCSPWLIKVLGSDTVMPQHLKSLVTYLCNASFIYQPKILAHMLLLTQPADLLIRHSKLACPVLAAQANAFFSITGVGCS